VLRLRDPVPDRNHRLLGLSLGHSNRHPTPREKAATLSTEHSIRPLSEHDVPAWDDEADVVIVGFGHAGAAAALGALEQTDDVLILERGGGSEGTCGGVVY